MMNQKKTLLSIAVGLVLAGCGGGSDYVAPVTASSSGKVVDGYVRGATVLCDTNGNGVVDAGEATTQTGLAGDFTFTPACAAALVTTGGTNIDTNLPFKGVMKAPANSLVVTPVTSLMADGGLTAAQVAAALGLPAGTDVTKLDPVLPANFELQKRTLAIQLIVQQTAEALGAAAGGVSPDNLRLIYSAVAKSLSTALATSTTPLINTTGIISTTTLTLLAAQAVNSLKTSTIPALAAAAATVNASALASTFATQTQSLLNTTSASGLAAASKVLDDVYFAAQTNVLSITNDTIVLNGGSFALTNFASAAGVTLAKKVSPLDTVSFGYTIKGTPIPAVNGTNTARVSLGIEMSDTGTKGQVLQFVLDQADVSIANGQLAVAVPASAKLYAYGKTANGTTANVTLTNIAADQFLTVSSNQLSFNAGKVLGKLAPAQAAFAGLQNVTGTFNLKVAVSNLNIAGQAAASVQGLSVAITGTSQTMSGLGVQGKFTVN